MAASMIFVVLRLGNPPIEAPRLESPGHLCVCAALDQRGPSTARRIDEFLMEVFHEILPYEAHRRALAEVPGELCVHPRIRRLTRIGEPADEICGCIPE